MAVVTVVGRLRSTEKGIGEASRSASVEELVRSKGFIENIGSVERKDSLKGEKGSVPNVAFAFASMGSMDIAIGAD